ncbi:MAG: hypothetical protein M1429_00470 [Patescibacteria group bacterium]|nr:hypothetical protein [Patescibacteria group bacterium]
MVECAERVYIVSYNKKASRLTVGFNGSRSAISEALCDAAEGIKELHLDGGEIIKLDGSIPAPIALLLGHELGQKYTVAVYDPSNGLYLVAVSHNPSYLLGTHVE